MFDNDTETQEEAMKYMLLIYQGTAPTPRSPDQWERLSEDEKKVLYADYKAINEARGVSPGLVLQPAEKTAITVRVEDGEALLTDGPFGEIDKALDSYLLFEADDLDAAVDLAARIPAARLGGAVEVRPVVERS